MHWRNWKSLCPCTCRKRDGHRPGKDDDDDHRDDHGYSDDGGYVIDDAECDIDEGKDYEEQVV